MNEETKSVAEMAAETKAAFTAQIDEVKALATDAIGKAEKGELLSQSVKDEIDVKLTGFHETKARLDELEQKMARGGSEETAIKSAGAAFVESDEYKAFAASNILPGKSVAVEMKAITSLTTNADGSAGDLVRAERVQGMMAMIPDRRMTVRDLLAPGTTSASSVEYVQETGFTNLAGMVAEAALKPESSLKFDLKTAPVRKIAHWMLASSEILADAPGLQSMIDYRLRYGLEYKEEGQLLNGDGTGQNLLGLIPQATAYAAAFVPSALTAIDTMRLAALQAALAEYPATGHVMHPTDWARIELTKDTQGRYIIGNPQGGLAPTLWGLPVVATQAISIDKFLTGAFRGAAQVFDRMAATVLVSTEDSDNFRKNLVTILAEERLALAVYRPEAFIYGDLGFVV